MNPGYMFIDGILHVKPSLTTILYLHDELGHQEYRNEVASGKIVEDLA